MPLRRQGVGRFKSFWYGQLSAIVEPIAGVIGALAVVYMQPILPYALAFAAGAMIYVVIEEVVPESQRDKYTDISTLGIYWWIHYYDDLGCCTRLDLALRRHEQRRY